MAAYLTQPLKIKCNSLESIRSFLRSCRYVSDKKQFDRDYWMPPEQFEHRRQGDCDCAAIWTWRQLIDMGIEARFVVGTVGGNGHAWVTYQDGNRWYLLEPWAAALSSKLP